MDYVKERLERLKGLCAVLGFSFDERYAEYQRRCYEDPRQSMMEIIDDMVAELEVVAILKSKEN